MDDKAGRIIIEVDCETKPPILDGIVGEDRLIEFCVYGPEGSRAEIFNLPIHGRWRPFMVNEKGDPEILFVPPMTIKADDCATLRVDEDNRMEYSVRYLVRCTCPDGRWYMARGQNPPPRMIIRPAR